MINETLFDLQRFDDEEGGTVTTTATNEVVDTPLIATATPKDTLVGSAEGFTWQNGSTFVGTGTAEDPVQLNTTGKGTASIAGNQIYLKGTKDGYGFAINEVKDEWDVDLQGTKNVISGDFSQAEGAYGLNGKAVVNVKAGKTFNEILDSSATYVQNRNEAELPVTLESDGSSAINYTFADGVANVAVGIDSNDKAVFAGAATNVSLGAAAQSDAIGIGLNFADGVTVTSSDNNVVVTSATNTITNANGEAFEFEASARKPVTITNGTVVSGATKGVTFKTNDGIGTALTVNGVKWDAISGNMDEIRFDKEGNAHVSNTEIIESVESAIGDGSVTVKSSDGGKVGFEALTTAGVVANNVTVQADNASISTFAIDLDENGIEGLAFDQEDGAVKVSGDGAFEVKAGKNTYNVATNADNITFDVVSKDETRFTNETTFNATVVGGKEYSVTGGDAEYLVTDVAAGGRAAVSINGAAVAIKNSSIASDFYRVSSDKDKAGVDFVGYLKTNDEVSVTGDSDGYTVTFLQEDSDGLADEEVVTFTANSAKISVQAQYVDANIVTITADSSGTEVTVQGIEGDAVVSVASGATYHFKNSLARNEVTVGGSAYTAVTLSSGGDVVTNPASGRVEDIMNDDAATRVGADENKWTDISNAGKSSLVSPNNYDTVVSNHAQVYEDFYSLNTSGVASNTVAGYTSQDDTAPTSTESAINISGQSPIGTATAVGDAAHVTLTGDSNVGRVPINIQKNESPNVTDVTVNLTNSDTPSTVAVGTTGAVTASHAIQLSNAGTAANPSTAYLGNRATGENVVVGGTGSNAIRHDGDSRASIAGGTSNDTIRGAVHDIVSGGTGGDLFYDTSGYAVDYNVADGDVIIASRLNDLSEVQAANVRGIGNQVGFGNGEYLLTLGNIDPNSAVHVKVAVMNDDGNVVSGIRDVVLANGNGIVDATAAGTNGALVVANAARGAGVHAVVGSAGADTITVGNYDTVSGASGDDAIAIDEGAVGVAVAMSAGNDTVSGWTYGFNRAAGATQLLAGGAGVTGRVFEDRLLISLEGGENISFDDTADLGDAKQMHGQYNILIDDRKFIGIRNGDAGAGYAEITNNDEIADAYFAEREGTLIFTDGVTENLGTIDLASANYQDIRNLVLHNNSSAVVYGSADRETVVVGGEAVVGANKIISLGGGNDYIVSGGNTGIAAHDFLFAKGDGRDTIVGYNHYSGINDDPDKTESDVIILGNLAGLKVDVDENARTRVEFALSETDQLVVYEDANAYDYNKDMYHVLIADSQSDGIAKIGYSTIANTFSYDKEVDYYIGSSGEARDTLVINATNENVEVRMDGQKQDGKFYRGIGVIDASAATYTNTTLTGSAANNSIVSGGEGTINFLWGGAGSNTLVGGAGQDFFLYTKNANAYVAGADHSNTGGTNDLIYGYDCNTDSIILSDVTIADINYAAMAQAGGNYGITENAVTVAFNNGGSVTVDPTNQDRVRFYLNDGRGNLVAYSANRETGSWQVG